MFMWTGLFVEWWINIHPLYLLYIVSYDFVWLVDLKIFKRSRVVKSAYCECVKFLEYLHTAPCWEQYRMPGISCEDSTHLSLSADAVLSGLLEPRSVKVKSDVVTWSPWPRYTRSRRRILLPYSTGPNLYQSLVEGRRYMFIEGGLQGGFWRNRISFNGKEGIRGRPRKITKTLSLNVTSKLAISYLYFKRLNFWSYIKT